MNTTNATPRAVNLPCIPSNMTDAECFRLYGTLPADRIERLIDAQADASAAIEVLSEHLNTIADAMPNEDFAKDVLYDLDRVLTGDYADEDDANALLAGAHAALKALQGAMFNRTKAALTAIRGIEGLTEDLSS
jgi:hypothetical protein